MEKFYNQQRKNRKSYRLFPTETWSTTKDTENYLKEKLNTSVHDDLKSKLVL